MDVGVIIVSCGWRGVLLVVVEGPEDLWVGRSWFVDAGEEVIDGATEEGMGGGVVRRKMCGVGVDDS